ncbi:MAG: hypothetical protein SFV81_09485 [Pirellulaceae bacterium]|nr:hypothetical protein [Pirellulaceae bacterium]
MRIMICVGVAILASVVGAGQASAQYPSYGGHGYGHGQVVHHDHHYGARIQPYPQSFAPAFGYGNSYSSGYGNAIPVPQYQVPQYSVPQVSSYYSNNYYSRPQHSHHSWHPGHYLLGHH